jgi:sugar diacid utilization regulator
MIEIYELFYYPVEGAKTNKWKSRRGGIFMPVTLSIILDELRHYHLEVYPAAEQESAFSKCLPIPGHSGELQKNCLYVGGLSAALELGEKRSGFICICLRDRIKDSSETESLLAGLVIVNENMARDDLLSQVQNRFFAVLEWSGQLHNALIRGGSMQEVVDLAALMIDNHIEISDSSFMLMARSRNIPCDDPICLALAEYGYHPEETVRKFRQYNLFKTWEKATDIFYDESTDVAKYPTLHKIFKFKNMYYAHMVLTCNRHPVTPGMIDLFRILVDVLEVCVERAWREKCACIQAYDSFLTDLIEGNLRDKKVMEERAGYISFPVGGHFRLFQIAARDSAEMSVGKMLEEFSYLFPRFKFIRYRQQIVAIHNFSPREMEEQLAAIHKTLESFLEKYDSLCGVSTSFTRLEEAPYCYRQTTLALKYADRLRGCDFVLLTEGNDPRQARLHYFGDSCHYCLLGECGDSREIWYHSEYHHRLKKLREYDRRRSSDNLRLLYYYLLYERRVSETAKALRMHRNSVLYRISRIEELLEIDLNDLATRKILNVSFVLLILYGFYGE